MTQPTQPTAVHPILSACLVSLCALALACTATPVPEPPDFQTPAAPDPDFINRGNAADVMASSFGAELHGAPGAACPGCTLRVTDIDTQQATVTTTVAADGSFNVTVPALAEGHWLRLETVGTDGATASIDVIFATRGVTVPEVPTCIAVTPKTELLFGGREGYVTREIQLTNGCASAITSVTWRLRLNTAYQASATQDPWQPATETTLTVSAGTGIEVPREDHLVLDAQLDSKPFRFVWVLRQSPP